MMARRGCASGTRAPCEEPASGSGARSRLHVRPRDRSTTDRATAPCVDLDRPAGGPQRAVLAGAVTLVANRLIAATAVVEMPSSAARRGALAGAGRSGKTFTCAQPGRPRWRCRGLGDPVRLIRARCLPPAPHARPGRRATSEPSWTPSDADLVINRARRAAQLAAPSSASARSRPSARADGCCVGLGQPEYPTQRYIAAVGNLKPSSGSARRPWTCRPAGPSIAISIDAEDIPGVWIPAGDVAGEQAPVSGV